MTTASDLADELEALSKAATQAPWSSEDRRCWDSRKPGNEAFSLDGPGWGSFAKFVAQLNGKNTDHPEGVANRDLTLALRNNLPTILAALRQAATADVHLRIAEIAVETLKDQVPALDGYDEDELASLEAAVAMSVKGAL